MIVKLLFWKTKVLLDGIQIYYYTAWFEFPSLLIKIKMGAR
jgi:hypothetical protein